MRFASHRPPHLASFGIALCLLVAFGLGSATASSATPGHARVAATPVTTASTWSAELDGALLSGVQQSLFDTDDQWDIDLVSSWAEAEALLPVADQPPPAPAIAPPGAWFVAPVPGPVTGPFGLRFHPILHYTRMHNGVDMTAPCGQPVASAAAGKVIFAGVNGGYGNLVVVDHGIINGVRLMTKYGHLSAFSIHVGDTVSPGSQIGLAGTTGLSTGCHLHFEVMVNGSYVDPAPYLNGAPAATLAPATVAAWTPTSLDAASIKARIRYCESSNNYSATNPTSTASGAYQFLDGTWRGIPTSITGGTARAKDATPAQQDAAFDWLYARAGTTPWLASSACWNKAGTVPTTPTTPTDPVTPTPEPSDTPTPEPSGTPTPEPSGTPTPEPSGTPTPEPTPTQTATPSPTPTQTLTATPSPTPTEDETPATTPTPTATKTASSKPSPTQSATPDDDPTPTSEETP